MPDRPEITVLLKDWSAGNAVARDRLMPLVYDELQRIARRAMAIAADICVYTNGNLTVESISA